MRYSEVIKELEKNPTKTFESYDQVFKTRSVISVTKYGYYEFVIYEPTGERGREFSGNLHINDSWQEVIQDLGYKGAKDKWLNNIAVICTLNGRKYYYDNLAVFVDRNGNSATSAQKSYGVWTYGA